MRMVVKLASASNCSDGPNSRPQLFMKPFVSRFIGASRMPCHEIRKGLDLTRRFHDAYTSHDRSDLCQSARHGENQVSLCDGKDRGHKEWQSERDTPHFELFWTTKTRANPVHSISELVEPMGFESTNCMEIKE